ncbi:hypothetical protein ATANTOWER_015744 [Ataeniobius toweri]|uniref:Uncharacterized protein n=1 Tax=Ataeniobius toweri TaxID=208326 RepID=A0ABU7AGG9_9TELE|nr:hypothetical protein [Ataeniobius toweri]
MWAGADAVGSTGQLQNPGDGDGVCVGCSLSWLADYMQVAALILLLSMKQKPGTPEINLSSLQVKMN